MEPTIPDGSMLLVDTRAESKAGTPAGIYVLRAPDATGTALLLKRLQMEPTGGLLITSDNPAYPQISIPAEERGQVHIIGRAVWAGRRL